jgi:hypothetical protein
MLFLHYLNKRIGSGEYPLGLLGDLWYILQAGTFSLKDRTISRAVLKMIVEI